MTLMSPAAINSIGLILDITGALLIWKYGLPESINKNGGTWLYTLDMKIS